MNKYKFTILFAVAFFGVFFFNTRDAQAIGCGTPHGSTYDGLDYASSMTTGQVRTIGVGFINCGTNTWTAAANYNLGTQDPQDNLTWGLNRVSVGGDVAPGVRKVFYFNITAPSTPGTYVLRFMMVHDGVTWFGDATPYVTVSVTAPALTPSCSSAGPEGAVEAYGTTWHATYAYGVANSNQVLFPARRIGVDADWVWWPGSNLGGGTWLGNIPHGSTFVGTVWVHVYLGSASTTSYTFCGTANYTVSAPAAPTVSIAAYQPSIPYGGSTGVYWSSSGAVSSCTVSPFGSTAQSIPSPGQPTGVLYTNTTYTISCTGPGGTSTASATVYVGAPPPHATCSGVTVAYANVPYNSTSLAVTTGTVANATKVRFPTWSAENGQDDIIWYKDESASGGWTVNVNPSSHPGLGTVYTDVYAQTDAYPSEDVYCGGVTFNKKKLGTITITNPSGNSWTLSGDGCNFRAADCSGTGNKTITDMMYGNYTINPVPVSGYSASVTPSSTIELKD